MTPHTVLLGSSQGHSWESELVRIGMVASPVAAGEDVLGKKVGSRGTWTRRTKLTKAPVKFGDVQN